MILRSGPINLQNRNKTKGRPKANAPENTCDAKITNIDNLYDCPKYDKDHVRHQANVPCIIKITHTARI